MKLHEIDLAPHGAFLPDGNFRIDLRHLPRRWDFLLADSGLAARFCQNGLVSLQCAPPSGRILCESAPDCAVPPVVLWIDDGEPFTHVFSPVSAGGLREPDHFSVTYSEREVCYELRHRDWEVNTVFRTDSPALLARFEVINRSKTSRNARVSLAVATLNAAPGRAAWDPIGLYQRASSIPGAGRSGILVENLHPGGDPSQRVQLGAFVAPEADDLATDRSVYTGPGGWAMPAFVLQGATHPKATGNHGVEAVAAFGWNRNFAPGKRVGFRLALTPLKTPSHTAAKREANRLLSEPGWNQAGKPASSWNQVLEMQTPDGVLDDYATQWLPRQLQWVALLDRGWPSGLRGVRDAAQDFSAVAWFAPGWSREVIRLLFSAQRRDGWFPRQVALPSSKSGHDMRPYVDSGCWVVELLWDYLRLTGDISLLDEKLPWLDGAPASTIGEHLQHAAGYYLKNRGPHGLVLIRGGDWNDAIHLAGLKGSGESVMASCQAVLALNQVAAILADSEPDAAERLRAGASTLRSAIRKAAITPEGFLRGVCTDDGRWIFSERDPDGVRRINTAVQAWAILSGVLNRTEARRVLRLLQANLGPHGYRLFYPPMGEPPIPGVGRVASGDLLAGVAENGTVYNHGSQAFLARAAAVAGDGDLLWELIRRALPCSLDHHPVATAKTPPYAIVNCWMETPGHEGEGGGLFLTGAVGVLWRTLLEGMLGFQPGLDGIRLAPCLPAAWPGCRFSVTVRNIRFEIEIVRAKAPRKAGEVIPWSESRVVVSIGKGAR